MLAVTEQHLAITNRLIAGVGALLWVGWLARRLREQHDPLADTPDRGSRLSAMAVSGCVFAWLLAAATGRLVFEKFLGPRLDPQAGRAFGEMLPSVVGQVAGVALCLWLATVCFDGGLRAFGFRVRAAHREAFWGVLALLMAFPLCWSLLFVSEAALQWYTGQKELPSHPTLEMLADPRLPLWARGLVWVSPLVIAPVAEEIFFRGIVQSFLRQHLANRWLVVLAAGAFFGGAHIHQPQVVLPLTALGVVLGYLYERRGSLAGPIVLHLLFNLNTLVWQTLLHGSQSGNLSGS